MTRPLTAMGRDELLAEIKEHRRIRENEDGPPTQTQAKLEEVTARAHRYEQENIELRRQIERLESEREKE